MIYRTHFRLIFGVTTLLLLLCCRSKHRVVNRYHSFAFSNSYNSSVTSQDTCRQNEIECTTNLISISQSVHLIHSKGTICEHLRHTFTQSWRITAAGDKWIRVSPKEVTTKHAGWPKLFSSSLILSPFMVCRAAGLLIVTPAAYQVHYRLRQHAESQELRVTPHKEQREKKLDFFFFSSFSVVGKLPCILKGICRLL